MKKTTTLLLASLLLFTSCASKIRKNNGSVVTGDIIRSNSKEVFIVPKHMDQEISIPRENISKIGISKGGIIAGGIVGGVGGVLALAFSGCEETTTDYGYGYSSTSDDCAGDDALAAIGIISLIVGSIILIPNIIQNSSQNSRAHNMESSESGFLPRFIPRFSLKNSKKTVGGDLVFTF